MREFLKKLYFNSSFAQIFIDRLLSMRSIVLPKKYLVKTRFKRKLGYSLDLLRPKTFNEKIQWLKFNDRSDLHTTCADKYLVRDHIKETIGEKYLIPLIMATENPMDISPNQLPDYPFVIKTNHDSGGVTLVWNKDEVDWDMLKKTLKRNLQVKYDYGKEEWQYKGIRPKIVIEKIILSENGGIPMDYKLHCFNGKVELIQVDMDRATAHKRSLYDQEWNFIDCSWAYPKGRNISKPECLTEMIEIAERLAQDFIFVRVDLYNIGKKVYFGELTFHPDSGNGKFIPKKWDRHFGDKLRLPETVS